MKPLLYLTAFLLTSSVQAADRPNIVWIIPDDMSANFSCYGETAIETGIAVSVIALGSAIAADRQLPVRAVMGAVVFFGFFHGYAHGVEIPNIARPAVYAGGFLLGTALIHLLGVLVGGLVIAMYLPIFKMGSVI